MTLLEQIAQGESAFLEFKEARPKDSLKFVKTVVAFANGRGGRLLFGVENETGRLVGIPREKVAIEMDAIADAISNLCSSPGGFVREMTVEDAKNGFSKIRNHSIGAALEYMGEVEGWGGGVSRYFESCAKMNLKPPSVIDEASTVKVTFFRTVENRETSRGKSDCGNEKGDEKRKENGKRKSREMILSSLALHPDWTTADLMRETGLSRSGVEKNIRQLKAVGLLCRNGADNGGVWQVAQT